MTSCEGEAYLGQQLMSILDQTVAPDQVVLGDDASRDGSLHIARSALAGSGGAQTVLPAPSRMGLLANLTRCIERAMGDIVLFADQDDIWRTDKLETLVRAFTNRPETLLAFTDAGLIGPAGEKIPGSLWEKIGFGGEERKLWKTDPIAVLSRKTVLTGATMAVRRPFLLSALPFAPSSRWHDEWLAWAAVLKEGSAPLAVAEQLIDYRVHAANVSGLPSGEWRQRLAGAGWPKAPTLTTWRQACVRFGPTNSSARLEKAVFFHERRPAPSTGPLRRIGRVAGLYLGGSYHAYGGGALMALHDAAAPLLYGRHQV